MHTRRLYVVAALENQMRSSLFIALVAGCVSNSTMSARAADLLARDLRAGGREFLINSGRVVYATPNSTWDERMIEVPGTPGFIVTWLEKVNDVPTSMCLVSPDGVGLSRPRENPREIALRYATFDPKSGEPTVIAELQAAKNENLWIVQFKSPELEPFLSALMNEGADPLQFLANDARIVRASEDEIHRIAQLPFVRWTGRFHPAYRIDDATRARVLGEKQLRTSKSWQWPEAFNIQVFQFGPNQKAIVADRVRALGGKVIAQIDNGYLLRASLTPAQLLAIIRLDEVAFVDPWQAPQNDMDVAREIGGANYVSTQRNFRGQGVRGEVLDGGFLLTHVDFQGPAPMSHTANGSDASHGTSTYGIVFGKGISNPLATGMLPAAEQGIYAAYPGLPDRYAHTAQLVNPALAFKAVFQSNSWGGGLTTAYTTESMEMDDIIYRTDLLICQSQSNAGSTSSRPQAWAKNIVSVGGVQHQNSLARTDDRISGASTGPAADGRIKPDLCHFYDEVMTTTNTSNSADTPDFGGTSAATPIVAGHFGLLFQMWHEGIFAGFGGGASVFADRPHAATAKALMINTAFPYSFTTPYFITRVRQGWGMPDLTEMYDRRADFFIINQTQALRPFTSRTYRFLIPAGTAKFRATMVYADRAGTTSSSVHRINDLSLKVSSPAFSLGLPVYHWGNNGLSSQQFSLNFGSSDRKNTVENVFVNNPAAGLWTVEVFGDEIVQDTRISTPQLDADFALVVRATGLVSLCTADIDANGLVEAADLAAYLDAYQLGTAAADTDDGSATGLHDGGVTIDDLLYYLGRYGAGC